MRKHFSVQSFPFQSVTFVTVFFISFGRSLTDNLFEIYKKAYFDLSRPNRCYKITIFFINIH